MENIFYEELNLLDTVTNRVSSELNFFIVECSEKLISDHYLTESSHTNIIDAFKKFIATIVSAFQTFYNNMTIKLNSTIQKLELSIKLREKRKELLEKKNEGVKYVTVIDIEKYLSTYLKCNSDLWLMARRFEKVKYKRVEDIDEDLKEFNEMKIDFENKLKKITDKPIKMRVDKALDIVESELHGSSKILKTISETSDNVKRMKAVADQLAVKKEILGADVIPQKIGFFKKIINSISNFVKRHVVKLVSTIVFLFA